MIGIYFIGNISPDYEGIVFLLEDGTYERIGIDEPYTPVLADFTMLTARLVGFSAKFSYLIVSS